MRSMVIIRILLRLQFFIQVNVIHVTQEMKKLFIIREMRSFYLTIQPWRSWLDIHMPYREIFYMPVEFGLKFMAIVYREKTKKESQSDT